MTDAGRALAALVAARSDPAAVLAIFNDHRSAFDRLIGLAYTAVSADAVEAEVPVTPQLLQPYGLVHGGVYATIVESLASAGAAMSAMARGQATVGLENATSFLHGTRGGTLRARATPLSRGRRTQVWGVEIRDDDGRPVASGRVRMLCLEGGATIAGESVALRGDDTSEPASGAGE
ncbi:PaaI family thioesterase [Nannocystis bainbridge]|uniref:PaaI family thioesterase n=1 Tax=Nannocystis bainbridge TaxID=2995303 RepID=A0ABT5EED1_9BACT|nr:PaaI family thioesterase [Nannocystis bainbridge]MDC0720287.1 PaaI family thioesterase [Nannocystis bainbridge]MDC0723764.1 PaaI family thioesterase [Nannocystis bainbridge]MDC0723770.1 PaaI family thioesterase [Nannocystis bainbridge]